MVFNKTEKQEREYLQQVLNLLKSTIGSADASVKEHVDTLAEYKDYLWSNKDIDPQEIRSMRESILNHFAVGESVISKRWRLAKMLDIPYFGRIDFAENGEKILPVYIGIHTFYDAHSKTNLVYDWRAPIAGMFYDFELGKSSYISPAGEVFGSILLKRQYRIRGGKMEFMIENSLAVHDDILQKELSANADDKMKNIVATIQREQNQIIRNESSQTLIIQGVAGSGKTSIALHRIAYLLYRFKENISAKDMLIISPSKVFADYISNVLPELGEESIPEIGMEKILSDALNGRYKFQNFFEQVNELLTKSDAEFAERIRYKASFEFVSQLDKFILHVENSYFKAEDFPLKHITIPAEFIAEQFRRFHRYPMRHRFDAMTDYILEMAQMQYRIFAVAAERNALKKAIRKMFLGGNDIQLYKDFFAWTGKPEMFKMRKNGTLEYADLAPLAYLRMALDGHDAQHHVKHLLIDEMQDYSSVQYKVLQKIFPCRKTILGDAAQSVNPYGASTAEMIQRALVAGEVMTLNKSYRSTFEIAEFAQKIRKNEALEPVARHGEKPKIVCCENDAAEILAIADLINAFKKSKNKSLGIICKTESQAREMAENLKPYAEDIYLLSGQSSAFAQGVVVTSAHVAKGLEFDEVIVPQANACSYRSEIDRSMLYVAVTRAMHKLTLTYSGAKIQFL